MAHTDNTPKHHTHTHITHTYIHTHIHTSHTYITHIHTHTKPTPCGGEESREVGREAREDPSNGRGSTRKYYLEWEKIKLAHELVTKVASASYKTEEGTSQALLNREAVKQFLCRVG